MLTQMTESLKDQERIVSQREKYEEGVGKKVNELEANLGIVNVSLKEVILMSDLSKVNPLEEQKKKEREARLLVKKLNEDRRIREKNKMIKYEELKQK